MKKLFMTPSEMHEYSCSEMKCSASRPNIVCFNDHFMSLQKPVCTGLRYARDLVYSPHSRHFIW
jgi:hypothetical protein